MQSVILVPTVESQLLYRTLWILVLCNLISSYTNLSVGRGPGNEARQSAHLDCIVWHEV